MMGLKAFGYFQVIIGNWIGYLVVAFVLKLSLYYRLNLTSIYRYLHSRFLRGGLPDRGAFFFILFEDGRCDGEAVSGHQYVPRILF